MKTAVFVLGMLASVAIAKPHVHNHRRRAHPHPNKRDVVTDWVTETIWETVTELVDDSTTETIFPASHFVPPKPAAAATTSSKRPGQFFEGASSAPNNAPVQTAPAAPPAAQTPPPPPPPPPAPAPSPAPAPPAPAANSPSPSPQVQVANPVPAGAKSGDLTYFTLGLGACGNNDGGQDYAKNVVALSYLLMGERSNDNPYCGRTITVSYGGKTTTATVVDKCMDCAHDNIDGSQALFTFFQPLKTGRFQVQWWFND
ncbi:RlpA-like double-psi beta-barrel-protein domain-containing protein-containing protein [Echria macrotheca]|uniref:RlpA-like double-psi beta-barrel-protein domain-containing protein-containing protein n=1 Tax=Echria macrotheca TaxID=438768 RepID=A0AAJ0BD78_9PEZI|nr:RlpA-like double-psi beta-barrel-protein domain-containing protein-containing protein [Echria macrotheca]